MSKVVIGKYVNTHGIKGEIKIKSNFKYKDRIFKSGNEIIIDKPYIINSYRVHKEFDMVTLQGIDNIESIPFPKNSRVYIERNKYLNNNEYVDDDLKGFNVYVDDKLIGKISNIVYLTDTKKLLVVDKFYIPYELVKSIYFDRKQIMVDYVEGLFNEN